ncbi:MAG: capsule assembly Wzi family protein, partial [Gammaproteobacteria bacterium]
EGSKWRSPQRPVASQMSVFNGLVSSIALLAGAALACPVLADPWAMPGDMVLREDIQRLADAGVISSPVTTWPMPWATIDADLERASRLAELPPAVQAARARVAARLARIRGLHGIQPVAELGARTDSFWLRGFEDTPREENHIRAGASWMGERFAVRLQATFTADPLPGDQEWRADGSYAAVVLGNHILSGGAVDRWWGPSWDHSLIYSNNARPVAGFTLERNVAKPFGTKWLSWLGAWTYNLHWGFLGHDREVPNARLLAFRLGFRPTRDLEFGLARTAIWCGEGRPCDAKALWNVIVGRDNRGGEGITEENDPSNQLFALDLRWQAPFGDGPWAIYTQAVAEDEAGGFPSRWFGQFGAELWGSIGHGWLAGNWRARLEYTDTLVHFWQAEPYYDLAYEHGIYETGYRFEGRSLGSSADGDSAVVTAGASLVRDDGSSWNARAGWAEINREGDGIGRDLRHTVTSEEVKSLFLNVSHRREVVLDRLNLGYITLGLGVSRQDNQVRDETDTEFQAFAQWTWDFSGI